MIVYGTKANLLGKETVAEKCPGCGRINSVEIQVYQKYAHVFWIPFFPLGKTGVSQCQHCKQALKLKEMPDTLKNAWYNLKQQTKTPLWMFSGIALLVLLITVIVISGKQKDARNAKLILAPVEGDIFEAKQGSNYTLYKVDGVVGDTVYILFHKYETNKLSGLRDLKSKGDADYINDPQPFLKKEIKQMFDDGKIIDIDRK
jgi:hypothetical protein